MAGKGHDGGDNFNKKPIEHAPETEKMRSDAQDRTNISDRSAGIPDVDHKAALMESHARFYELFANAPQELKEQFFAGLRSGTADPTALYLAKTTPKDLQTQLENV